MINLIKKAYIYYISLTDDGIVIGNGKLISITNKSLLFGDNSIVVQNIMQQSSIPNYLYDKESINVEYKILTNRFETITTYQIFETWDEANDYLKKTNENK